MEIHTGLIIIIGVHCTLLFFHIFFKSCAHYPYLKLLEGFGLNISFLTIKWKTKAFNRTLIRWGSSRPCFLHLWFTLGIYASFALLPISIILLFNSLLQSFIGGSSEKTFVIEAVVPGINLPASELGYYTATLLICGVVHELGHALAAVLEDVNVIDVGCNIFFIFPVAYVNISTERFSSLTCRKTLNIICAGAWHNIVLTFVAFLLYCLLPYLFSPLYYTGKGVSISQISKASPLQGFQGLNVGDTIFRVNDCEVSDENTWYDCLKKIELQKPGFCIESDIIHTLDESVPLKHLDNGFFDCCDIQNKKNLCFEFLDTENGVLQLPSHACLPARTVVEKSADFCTYEPYTCPDKLYCFRPILVNSTNLFKIICNDKNVIYIGLVNDLYWTVEVSSYTTRGIVSSTDLPDIATKLLKYIIIISLGLAFLNVLPIMHMDGQHITNVIGYILLRKSFGRNSSEKISSAVTWFFTVLLGGYLLHSVLKMFFT